MRALILATILVGASGCDFSQKRPEVGATLPALTANVPALDLPWMGSETVQDRSIRLIGAGVSSDKQTPL